MSNETKKSAIRAKILRWAGSKTQSEGAITPFLRFDVPYIEPFCGSASFFFSQIPRQALLNDNNDNLISFYRHLQSNTEELWHYYRCLQTSKEAYYRARKRYNSMQAGTQKAAYFLYLNHFCFNGLYRTNLKGEFNTPFGSHAISKRKLRRDELYNFAEASANAKFYCLDFEEFLESVSPTGACIFIDPPYFTNDSRVFGEYSDNIFRIGDLVRLRNIAEKLAKTNMVVLTYKACSEFQSLFSSWEQQEISVTRNVGGFAGRRKQDTEIVARMGQL